MAGWLDHMKIPSPPVLVAAEDVAAGIRYRLPPVERDRIIWKHRT